MKCTTENRNTQSDGWYWYHLMMLKKVLYNSENVKEVMESFNT